MMRNHLTKGYQEFKNRAEPLGIGVLILGVVALVFDFVYKFVWPQPADLSSLWLALFALGWALVAIGMSAKADQKYTVLLDRLEKNVASLPTLFKNDVLTLSGQQLAREMLSDQSKEAAQKRLDEDTRKVGYVRGEIYQAQDGSWAIHWGGKYPL